jgi:signal transduction histidine kinase
MTLTDFIRKHRRELAKAFDDADVRKRRSEEQVGSSIHYIGQVLNRIADRFEAEDFATDTLADLATTEATIRYRSGSELADIVGQYSKLRQSFFRMYAREEVPQLKRRLAGVSFLNDCLDGAISASVQQFAIEAAHERDVLVAAIGHDLGNEIAVVGMAAAEIVEAASQARNIRDKAIVVSNSARLMTRMASDLADFTQLQHGGRLSIRRRPCEITSVCRQVIDGMLMGKAGRAVTLRSAGPSTGLWDPDRLAQLVRNLVSNALHHGTGETVVSVGPAKDSSSIEIAVSNAGPVIPADRQPMLFEPFRGNGSRAPRAAERLRLGLYMVKTIAHAHGGRVSFESSIERGTTFVVSLPINAPN